MNFVLLALVWSTIAAPGLPQAAQPVDLAAFRHVLGAARHVVASLLAYLVSQNWDVVVFHWLRDQTDGKKLWLRNIGSTATSQLIDTVIFIGVGFVRFGRPAERGAGTHRRPVPAKSRYRRSRHAVRLRCRRLCSAKHVVRPRRAPIRNDWKRHIRPVRRTRTVVSRHRFGPRPLRRPRRR